MKKSTQERKKLCKTGKNGTVQRRRFEQGMHRGLGFEQEGKREKRGKTVLTGFCCGMNRAIVYC